MRPHLPVRRSVRTALTVLVGAAVLSVAAGIGYAAIPSANGEINSCYDSQGYLRIIDVADPCPTGTTKLTFNQKGQGFQPKGYYNLATDKANGYEVGDVAVCLMTGDARQLGNPGAYVKFVKKAADRLWDSPGLCIEGNGWRLLTPQGQTGPRGPAGPSNVYVARVNDAGTVLLNRGFAGVFPEVGWVMLRMPAGVDARQCTVDPTPATYDVVAYRYAYEDPSLIYVLTVRGTAYVRAAVDITVNC